VNSTVIYVQPDEIQLIPARQADNTYLAYASNLKRNSSPGRVLGSFDLYIPSFQLHLHCTWQRDNRGRERVGMPRVRVETPNGQMHLKTLARWGSAIAEEMFQRAGLRALHQLLTRAEGGPWV
jgi:hypothetical protein